MMQDLIGARFQLKTHRETRELPVYELTVAKGGFKLKEIPPSSTPRTPVIPPPPPPGTAPPTNPAALPTPPDGSVMVFGSGFTGASIPLAALASTLSGILGRPVIDKTRLKGEYDFKFVYSRSGLPHNGLLSGGPAAPPAALDANDPMPSIFTAVQEQLGLKLDSTKGPVEVVVVDSVSKPIEN
jgi:uncharacterized protein (TIGR03435 family)